MACFFWAVLTPCRSALYRCVEYIAFAPCWRRPTAHDMQDRDLSAGGAVKQLLRKYTNQPGLCAKREVGACTVVLGRFAVGVHTCKCMLSRKEGRPSLGGGGGDGGLEQA